MTNDMLDLYAIDVFSDEIMQQRLPKRIYESLKSTMMTGADLDKDIAEVVAAAMKDWAVEKGATHFAHWFHPLTGMTAEKHDSFLAPDHNRKAVLEFSGSNLVKGEPDASSFPSGGLRDTFEARGYTSWDPTSPAFVKDGSLYIPSIFISYTGNVLDKKTPLLRSMAAINREGLRIMRLLGNRSTKRVIATMGAEQEYFLIDQACYHSRKDLSICGRTLFGAAPPKGQEFEDHYFSAISASVAAFMKELDRELWRLGVPAKIKHSEVAPCQFELVPVFDTCNVGNDQNQLVMACLNSVAPRHGMACLLHEKPFKGVNGSGKHVNWSLGTDDGLNLLSPGKTATENASFLIFVCAMIEAVDRYPELIRLVIGSAGNDHRLGGDEAPPAILSIFLGEELTEILESLEEGTRFNTVDKGLIELGLNTLPPLPKDNSDRNRTSPFAFTGNKFEFRMPGSSASVAGPNIAINTAVAEVLRGYADRLEAAGDFWSELNKMLAESYRNHKRVIFNGNNYSQEWVDEAERRGLPNIEHAVDSFPLYAMEKNIRLLVDNGIYTEEEVFSRMEIHMLDYSRTINIEALTMIEMVRRQIIPSVLRYQQQVLSVMRDKDALGVDYTAEKALAETLTTHFNETYRLVGLLEDEQAEAQHLEALDQQATIYHERVMPLMEALRETVDALERLVDEDTWGIPSYTAILLGA